MQQNPCKHCSISEMYDRVKHSLDKKIEREKTIRFSKQCSPNTDHL